MQRSAERGRGGARPPLDGGAILITGASSGIGREIARQLAGRAHTLILVARRADRLKELRDELIARNPRLSVLVEPCDLADPAAVERIADSTLEKVGAIDVLVNNAGGGIIRPFLEHDADSLATTLQRNLWTTIWCCHKVLPHMVAANHGRIVNIGADSLRTGIPQHAGYNAAKGGVIGLMVGLAREFAANDITVNTVSPCVVNTERHRARLKNDPTLADAFVKVVPKGRGVEIGEVCDMVSFLARAESGFMTGQDISLNGGSAMP